MSEECALYFLIIALVHYLLFQAVAGDEEGDVKDTWEDQEESDGGNSLFY